MHSPYRLDDSFGVLTAGPRTAEARHQTLRAVIDWSYDLLSEEAKRLVRRLSVFAGGWTVDNSMTAGLVYNFQQEP